MKCPDFERLLDYLDGRLAAGEADPVGNHLAEGCANCSADQSWYMQTRAVAAGDDSTEPPAWVTRRALRIFETQRPRLSERLGQAIAALVFDSFERPAVAGVRSTANPGRQLLYQAGDYSFDLQIVPSAKANATLAGQILREGETSFASVANVPVELSGAGKAGFKTATNQMGEFSISGIEPGYYDLKVETADGLLKALGIPVIEEPS